MHPTCRTKKTVEEEREERIVTASAPPSLPAAPSVSFTSIRSSTNQTHISDLSGISKTLWTSTPLSCLPTPSPRSCRLFKHCSSNRKHSAGRAGLLFSFIWLDGVPQLSVQRQWPEHDSTPARWSQHVSKCSTPGSDTCTRVNV